MSRQELQRRVLLGIAALLLTVFALNTSWLAPDLSGKPSIIAHRGVHIDFNRANLTDETCTAAQSLPPLKMPLENTLPSMRAAFELGAEVVEIDIHRTTDNVFAVFHDWTLECRTNGTGETRSQDIASLQALDIAYGYTADGVTFPLRGMGIGMLPTLDDVLDAFPDREFLIDFKSNDPADGELFIQMLKRNTHWQNSIWAVYGGQRPVETVLRGLPELRGFTRASAEDCLTSYILLAWSGHVPRACRDGIVLVPLDLAPFLWGWPDRFMLRMTSAGSEVVLRGPAIFGPLSDGIDTISSARGIPTGFSGFVWTNHITVVQEN